MNGGAAVRTPFESLRTAKEREAEETKQNVEGELFTPWPAG